MHLCPLHVSDHSLYKDLNIESVDEIAHIHYDKFFAKLACYYYRLITVQGSENIPNDPPHYRRLKKKKRRRRGNQLNSEH